MGRREADYSIHITMKNERIQFNWAGILAGIMSLCLTACQHGEPGRIVGPAAPSGVVADFVRANHPDPSMLRPSQEPYTLGPGDKVEIEVLGEAGSKATTIVAPDGKLYFDLLPGLDVWGKTLAQAKSLIETNFAQFVREPPKVSLILRDVESRRVWILGRVQAPGVYPMNNGPMTLLEAISIAGGTMSLTSYRDQEAAGVGQEMADLSHSFVVRNGKCLPVDFEKLLTEGDLTQNIYLDPDDFIYFPSAVARDVYVLGAVTEPRLVPYQKGLTLAGAIAGAYGTLSGAYLSHVAVVNGSLSQPHLTLVDYKKVVLGQAHDVALAAGDIVYVPLSPYRYLDHYIEIALDTFVASAAINAGTRQIPNPSGGAAGVFIPVGSGMQLIPPATVPAIH